MACAAAGSLVDAATPRAAWASVFRAWAVSRAATPGDLKKKKERKKEKKPTRLSIRFHPKAILLLGGKSLDPSREERILR